VGKEADLVYWR